MATITTSWTTIASKTWKSGSLSVKFLLQARVRSQSVANNSSVIQTRLRSERISYAFNGYPYKFTCSYCTSKSGSESWNVETEDILVSPNKTANHNADGTKSLSLSATAVITGLGMNVSLSGTATLPRINRIADLTSWPNFTDETNPTLKFTNPANYRIDIGFTLYDNNRHYVADYLLPIARYTSPYTIDMTNHWDEIRQAATTQKVYDAVVGISTYDSNENIIGTDYVDRTLTIVNANPTFDATYQDINSTTISITGDNQKIIRNQSNLQINISNAEGKKYATLSSIKAVINGITYNGTLSGTTGTIPVGTIDVSENIVAAVTLTDSRGYTTTNNIEIQVLNWELPTANITLQRQNNYYSETDIKVDANYSSLDGENVITIQERHKKTSEQNYSAYTTLTDNVTSTMTLDNQYEWDVQVLVQDLFGSTTYNLTLDKGMPIIYFDRLKRSVSINSFPQNNESLEVLGGDILEIIGDKTDTWSSSGSYAKDSFVTYERYIYKNKTGSNSGTPDSDSTNWDKVSVLDLIRNVSSGGGGGTTNYNDLGNKPSINGVTLSGNKTTSDLGIIIPTTTSQLTNNSGFITNSVNNLTNYTLSSALSSVATSGNYNDLSNKPTIPTQTSQLTNNSGFITNSVSDLTNYTKTSDLGAVALSNDYDDLDNKPTIPSKTSDLTNDSGYITQTTYELFNYTNLYNINSTSDTNFIKLKNCIDNNIPFQIEYSSGNRFDVMYCLQTSIRILIVYSREDMVYKLNMAISGTNVTTSISTFGLQQEINNNNKLDYSLIDNTPTIPTSTSQLTNDSGYITSSYHDSSKQDTLVSGTNIKTINNTSLLGSGNITIGGGGTATDVQINGTSITSGGTANILTNGAYSSSNKIATISDIPTIPTNVSAFTNDAGYITSSALPQDTGWVNISTTRGTWVYLRYRIIGKELYLEGRASSLSYSGSSTKIAQMPSGTFPSTGENHYFYGHLAGGRIARILVNTSGEIIVDWARNISDGNTYTTATWYSFSTTYFID